jgi:hypothetical protein
MIHKHTVDIEKNNLHTPDVHLFRRLNWRAGWPMFSLLGHFGSLRSFFDIGMNIL